ncbi:hypothetical protein, partial [Pseudomonas aeruginosa]|uniref:hypothetical protein n=1 Tax=Pseudomonas aeruginosa TaxID=287 RepID=UPI003BF4BF9B
ILPFAVSLRSWKRPSDDRFLDASLVPLGRPQKPRTFSPVTISRFQNSPMLPFAHFWTKSY